MFVGHYGVAFAIRARTPRLRLGVFFIAVQLLDILFAVFLLTGIEHIQIVQSPTSHALYDVFHFYDIPVSHSLVGGLIWSVIAAIVARVWLPWKESCLIGIAVVSHFFLDIPMHPNDASHPADLHIAGANSLGIGLGLWYHPGLAVAIELCTFLAGVALYVIAMRTVRPRLWVLIGVLSALAVLPLFIPAKSTVTTFAVQILFMTILIACWANWADVRRQSSFI